MKLCPFCEMEPRSRRSLEMRLHRSEITNAHVEEKQGWDVGTVSRHMGDHIDYTPEEASLVEDMRTESIDTLNTAESLLQRMMGWLDELEHQKDTEGITPELVASFTKLVGQCNASLKLVGQLKKEIGVDSQLFLADQREAATARILVDVLRGQPHLLDQVELRLAALKTPTYVVEYDGEVN
jgi:hypothetical protein